MPKPTLKMFQESYRNAQASADSYRTRNIQVEKELELSKGKIVELERDKQWLKQLAQNATEALNAFMRNR